MNNEFSFADFYDLSHMQLVTPSVVPRAVRMVITI